MVLRCRRCHRHNDVPPGAAPGQFACHYCATLLPGTPAAPTRNANAEAVGVLGGAALGAAVGGPFGAIVGGILGAIIGKSNG